MGSGFQSREARYKLNSPGLTQAPTSSKQRIGEYYLFIRPGETEARSSTQSVLFGNLISSYFHTGQSNITNWPFTMLEQPRRKEVAQSTIRHHSEEMGPIITAPDVPSRLPATGHTSSSTLLQKWKKTVPSYRFDSEPIPPQIPPPPPPPPSTPPLTTYTS